MTAAAWLVLAGCTSGSEPSAQGQPTAALKAGERQTDRSASGAAAAQDPGEGYVHIPPRTPQLPTFPCVAQCHVDREPNPTPRKLTEFHSLKQVEHGDDKTWCDRCHDLQNLDQLHLIDGRHVSFDQAYLLCGQCHGDKLRDFRMGIHGLQTGAWNGDKQRRSCTACHDPHAPRRPQFEALPAPDLLKEKKAHE